MAMRRHEGGPSRYDSASGMGRGRGASEEPGDPGVGMPWTGYSGWRPACLGSSWTTPLKCLWPRDLHYPPGHYFCHAVFALVSFSHSPTEGSRPRASRCSKRAWLLPALSGVSRVPWALPPKESNAEALPSTRHTGRREQGQHVCALCATVASREAVVKAPWIPLGHRRCPQSAWRRMRLERCSATCVSRCTHR